MSFRSPKIGRRLRRVSKLCVSPLVVLALFAACEESGGTQENTELEDNEEAALIIGESVALQSGGVVETMEFMLQGDFAGGASASAKPPSQIRLGDVDPVFNPDSCHWVLNWERHFHGEVDGDTIGFHWWEVARIQFLDEADSCLQFPVSTLRGIDGTRIFNGFAYNPRYHGTKSGSGNWEIREIGVDPPGSVINGIHQRSGEGQVRRLLRWIDYTFELSVEAIDLRVIYSPVLERRVPVEGTLHIVFVGQRGDREIHREAWITFGGEEGRGSLEFDNGDEWELDMLSGAVSHAD